MFVTKLPSLRTLRELNDMTFVYTLTNGLVHCASLMGKLMYRVLVRRTSQNHSFVIGNYSSMYTTNCPKMRMCKFVNDRNMNVLEVLGVQSYITWVWMRNYISDEYNSYSSMICVRYWTKSFV